jgi:hypothetical protein
MSARIYSTASICAFIVSALSGIFGVALILNGLLGAGDHTASVSVGRYGFVCLVICMALLVVGIFARRNSNSIQRY